MNYINREMYFTVVIYSHDNPTIYGAVHSPVLKNSVEFHDLTELVLMMDKIMRDCDIPKYDGKYRSFALHNKIFNFQLNYHDLKQENFEECFNQSFSFSKKPENIFSIHVMYRQNCTWQGEITWIEKDRVKFFRSALELIALINSAFYEDSE